MSPAESLTPLRRAYDSVRRSEEWAEVFEFLSYYLRLRRDVLLGRREARCPLGVMYPWRQWQYERHVRRARRSDWQP